MANSESSLQNERSGFWDGVCVSRRSMLISIVLEADRQRFSCGAMALAVP